MITVTTRRLIAAVVVLVPSAFFTGQLLAEAGDIRAIANSTNPTAISMFMVFVLATLGITYWAARRTHSTDDYYAAGGGISGTQNGFAIAGDFMSAASFLGASGLIYTSGYDALIYAVGGLAGWPLVLFMFAERLRNLGRYTFTDVVSFRLQAVPVRTLSALSTLVIITLYLIAQMVGAGALVQILFGLPYEVAVITVGILMILYVSFGGMIATTWVQIVKAALLLFGSTVLAYLVMREFGFSIEALFFTAGSVHPKGEAIFASGGLVDDPISTISLGLALVFGTAGLPHILMRFFTVPDAAEARKSALVATCLIGYFYILVIILGFGTIGVLTQDPTYSMDGELRGGSNMAVIHLSQAIAGDLFMGFISAVAFATILAVVSGLALSGASAIAHDVFTNVVRKGKAREEETILVSRLSSVGLGIVAILLGIVFRGQNVAYMVVLAFAVSASVNFPILFLSMYWRKLTTRGAVWGGSVGLVSAVTCIILGPTFWVEILGNTEAIFPFRYPALFSMSGAFLVAFIVSKLDKGIGAKQERDAFDLQYLRSVTGVGANDAARH